jgi:hypothetical protein
MRVHAEKKRTIDPLLRAVKANGLTNGKDMVFVKSPFERGAAVSGGSEGNPLR